MELEFYTPQEVAKKLRLNVNTVYEYIRMGKLRAARFGNRYRITEEDMEKFVKQQLTTMTTKEEYQ